MNLRRSCRLIIKQLVLNDYLDVENHTLIIKDKQGSSIKQIPMSGCQNLKLYVEAEESLIVEFVVLHHQTQKPTAVGLLNVEFKHLSRGEVCHISCQLLDQYSQEMAMLKIQLSFDDEKVSFNFAVKESDNSDTEEWADKSKLNNVSKLSGKLTRKRRHTYLLKDEHPKVVVNNKIISNKNLMLSNILVKLDGRVEAIIFRDKKSTQFIGQVKCLNNPSAEELQQCSLKVPVQFSEIEIQVVFIDSSKVFGSLFFNVIADQGKKNVNIPMYDEGENYQGNLYLSYHLCTNQLEQVGERLSLNTQILERQSTLIHPHLLKSLQNMQGQSSQHPKHTTSLLPQKYRMSINRSTLVSKTVDQKILPTYMYSPYPYKTIDHQVDRHESIYGIRERKRYMELEMARLREKELFLNRDHQSRFRQLEQSSQLKLRVPKNNIYIIRFSSVLINLHSIFFIKHNINMQRDVGVGKFVNLYSSHSHVFRSEQIFASQNLAWKLKNCQIQIKENDKLTVELCLSHDKSVIGESVSACYRLLTSLNYHNYYKGQLMYRNQQIGQLILNFKLVPLSNYPLSPESRSHQYIQRQRQPNKISRINERLRLGLPRLKNSNKASNRVDNDNQMRYFTPQRDHNNRYETLEEIPERRNKKKRLVFVRQ